jgi:outer membrane protein assembly factor BamB
VVQTQDAKVYGLAAADGSRRWLFEMDLPVLTLRGTATPLIVDDLVLVAFANGKLAALDADAGTPRWEARVAMPAGRTELERMVDVSTPALDGDIVYAVSYQGRVGAYTRGSGRELWARDMSSSRAPAVGRNQLYLVDTEDRVIALRATGGQELWSNPALRRRVPTAPLAIGDLVAVADGEGYLHLLSAVDGSFVGRRKVDGDGVSVPLATDGERIFVQDNSGDLSAFGVSGSVSGETGADSGK